MPELHLMALERDVSREVEVGAELGLETRYSDGI